MSASPPRRVLAEPNPYEAPTEPSAPAEVSAGTPAWLRTLDWRQFENLVANAYRLQGYETTLTKDGADGGIDLVLARPNERVLVQCKHWRSLQVGAPVVRELFGLVVAHHATGGVVVASGGFSQEAEAFAREQGIRLLDGAATMRLVTSAMVAPNTPPAAPVAAAGRPGPPGCPVCGSPMALRQARRGSHAGERFWGCTRYPSCRGMVQVAPGVEEARRGHDLPVAVGAPQPAKPPPSGLPRGLRRLVGQLAGFVAIMVAVAAAMYVVFQIFVHTIVPR